MVSRRKDANRRRSYSAWSDSSPRTARRPAPARSTFSSSNNGNRRRAGHRRPEYGWRRRRFRRSPGHATRWNHTRRRSLPDHRNSRGRLHDHCPTHRLLLGATVGDGQWERRGDGELRASVGGCLARPGCRHGYSRWSGAPHHRHHGINDQRRRSTRGIGSAEYHRSDQRSRAWRSERCDDGPTRSWPRHSDSRAQQSLAQQRSVDLHRRRARQQRHQNRTCWRCGRWLELRSAELCRRRTTERYQPRGHRQHRDHQRAGRVHDLRHRSRERRHSNHHEARLERHPAAGIVASRGRYDLVSGCPGPHRDELREGCEREHRRVEWRGGRESTRHTTLSHRPVAVVQRVSLRWSR